MDFVPTGSSTPIYGVTLRVESPQNLYLLPPTLPKKKKLWEQLNNNHPMVGWELMIKL